MYLIVWLYCCVLILYQAMFLGSVFKKKSSESINVVSDCDVSYVVFMWLCYTSVIMRA